MNTLAIAQELSALPDGVLMEHRRQRITSQLGLATGLVVQLPGSELPPGELREFFSANVEQVSDVLFQINEAIPFSVDRAIEVGYRVWEKRHELAYTPRAEFIFQGYDVCNLVPELDQVKVSIDDVNRAVALLREGLAV